MEFAEEHDTDRAATDNPLVTEISCNSSTLKALRLRNTLTRLRCYWVAATCTFLLLIISIISQLPLDIALSPLIAYDVCHLWLLIKAFKPTTNEPGANAADLASLQNEVVSCCMSLCFKTMIPFRHIGCPYQIMFIPFTVSAFFKLLRKGCIDYESYLIVNLGKVIYQLCRILTVLDIGLKLDEEVHWEWKAVLWPVWVLLSLSALMTVGSFLATCGSAMSLAFKEVARNELLVTLWVFCCLACFTVCFSCLFINIVKMLQSETFYAWPFAVPLFFTIFFCASSTLLSDSAL